MSVSIKADEAPLRFQEVRRFQVIRLERRRRRPLIDRLRRNLRARLFR